MIAVVVGGAAGALEEMAAAFRIADPDVILAANDVGTRIERLDGWCTLHPAQMPEWIRERRRRGLPACRRVIAHKLWRGVVTDVLDDLGGSSGLFAVLAAFELFDADRVILAGVPMTPEAGHFFDPSPWRQADRYRRAWTRNLDRLAPHVRSMSGWTRELLGEPDKEWAR